MNTTLVEQVEETMTEPSAEKNRTILIVDDEKDIGWVIGQILRESGYEVVTASSGAECLDRFKEYAGEIPIVLLDHKLPDASGIDLIEPMKKFSPKTKFVIITAFGTPAMKKLALEKGATEVLDKPFRVERMLKMVRLACEAYQPNSLMKGGEQNGCRENTRRGVVSRSS
jgi:two-component system NtrC family response regulator